MKNQIILACDEKGKFTGEYIPRKIGHTGQGRRHLAITVLLYNKHGEVLLQKRKHRVFDGVWDLTGATHPLHSDSGRDESFDDATLRCLRVEFGIERAKVSIAGAFNYFAQDGELCENEHCAILIGEYNGKISPNPDAVYDYQWIKKVNFLQDIERYSWKYSAWAVEGVKVLRQAGFFRN